MVLSTTRARRLARQATRGWPRWLAQRAWQILIDAAEHGDANAMECVWQVWLRDPADETWTVVSRAHTPADVFAAATDPVRNGAERAALGAFCARHDLAPENPVECAVFFVLTGQPEAYHALDPDGTLLAAGYRGADKPAREALRHTMTELGELDLVRVIADRPDRPLTAGEAEYLTGRLAREGRWRDLWRLIPTIPLASAVQAARLFGDWRPPDEAGRALFERLISTNPTAITTLGSDTVTTLEITEATEFSFAPDSSELAVAHPLGTTVFAVPGGQPIVTYACHQPAALLAMGAGAIVYHGNALDDSVIVRRSPRRRAEVLLSRKPGATIGRTPDGFVVVLRGEGLRLGTPEGLWARVVPASGLPFAQPDRTDLLATDPASGRLALTAPGELILLDSDLNVLAYGELGAGEHVRGAFLTPERLITCGFGDNTLVSWRVDGTNAATAASTAAPNSSASSRPPAKSGMSLTRVAAHRLAAAQFPIPVPGHGDRMLLPRGRGQVWLDAETLAVSSPPPGFPRLSGEFTMFSPDGTLAVTTRSERVEVHDLAEYRLAQLAGRSTIELGRPALRLVEALAARLPDSDVLALVRAGLEHRFGGDIALGDDRGFGRYDDIALGTVVRDDGGPRSDPLN